MLKKNKKNDHDKIRFKKGVVVMELIIAIAVSSLVLTSAMLVAFGGQTASLDVGLTGEGLYKINNHLNSAIAKVMENWTLTSAEALVDSTGFYSGESVITDITPCVKLVSGDVDWTSEKKRHQTIQLNTLITSVVATKLLGGDCDPFPLGDWDNPHSPVSDNIAGQSNATGVDFKNNFIYLTTNSSSDAAEDFFIYEFDDLAMSLTYRSALNTGPGLMALEVAGDYAYVLAENPDEDKQLLIINITDPDTPVIISDFNLPAAPTGQGRSVFYYNEKIYVGTQYLPCPPTCDANQNHEFHIIDVTDPADPVWLGSLNVNHNINGIVVSGDYAYLATSDNSGELMIINISDPTSLMHPDDTGFKFNPAGNQDGQSLYRLGQRIYLGLWRGAGGGQASSLADFYVLDITDPAIITEIGSRDLALNTNAGIVGIRVNYPLAFLAIDQPTFGFSILNISDPALVDHTTCTTFNFSENTTALDMERNFVVTANRSNAEIRIISDQSSVCLP